MYTGCLTAEWQSRSLLNAMVDHPDHPDGPDQEAALCQEVVATYEAALHVLQRNKADMLYRTAYIVGPWWQDAEGNWRYELSRPIELDRTEV